MATEPELGFDAFRLNVMVQEQSAGGVREIERKLVAILSADVQGYSRLMSADEVATVRTLTAYREVIATLIRRHHGRVVDTPGDNVLAEFASVVDAVEGAVAIQRALTERNAELPPERQMAFRIGVNLGDVVVEGEQIYGEGVNLAARLEGLAEAGGLCISGTVYEQVKTKVVLGYEDLGERRIKNMAEPVRVYRVRWEPEGGAASSPATPAQRGLSESQPTARPPGARRRQPSEGFTQVVGREAELGQLYRYWEKALRGDRQIVFVTGEPGIGKTTLVEAFLDRLGTDRLLWLGRGQCIEHYGAGEAYLPILEALGRLCRGPEGQRFMALLQQHAPTWLVQMPTLLGAAELEALQRKTQGATRERMMRELAEAYGKVGQPEEGLTALAEARALVDNTGMRYCEAQLYRLKGELTLQQSSVQSKPTAKGKGQQESRVSRRASSVSKPRSAIPHPQLEAEEEAEACFWKAIEIARRQSAKSLELRAVMSLSRLWQQQGKKEQARRMLAEIYNWFTEGFDTKDLQEAQALLEELSH